MIAAYLGERFCLPEGWREVFTRSEDLHPPKQPALIELAVIITCANGQIVLDLCPLGDRTESRRLMFEPWCIPKPSLGPLLAGAPR